MSTREAHSLSQTKITPKYYAQTTQPTLLKSITVPEEQVCSLRYTPIHALYLFFFFIITRHPPNSPLFPTTPLSRSNPRRDLRLDVEHHRGFLVPRRDRAPRAALGGRRRGGVEKGEKEDGERRERCAHGPRSLPA